MEKSNKAIEGKDGFLFLGGPDSNALIPHLTGEMRMSRAACAVHSHNAEALAQLRVPHLVLIVPEAHVVREDMLPDGVKVIPTRPVSTALSLLGEAAVYPLQMLRRMQEEGVTVYTGKDSHWTAVSAFETYRQIRARLGRRTELTDVYDPSDLTEAEDLCSLSPEETVRKERGIRFLKPQGFEFCLNTGIFNHGGISISLNPKGSGRCLTFGTSFSSRLTPAYACDFREVVFCYGTAIDEAVVKLVRPDVVIVEMPERFVHYPSMAVEGGAFASAHLAACDGRLSGLQRYQPDRLPADLQAFGVILNTLCNAAAARPDIARAIATIDVCHPLAARRVAVTMEIARRMEERRALRAAIGGVFRRPDVLGRLSAQVDADAIQVSEANALPGSEMGLLTTTRLMMRTGLFSQARTLVAAAERRFGVSQESTQYRRQLGG